MAGDSDKHVLAYDLSNLAYISAHLLPKGFELRPDGADRLFTNLVSYVRRLYRQFRPDHIIFACDSSPYWRETIFPDYKGHRPDTELRRCVRDALSIFKTEKAHLCCEVPGCEADDVIYALTQTTDKRITLVSMDGDFFQLLNSRVRLFNPRAKQYMKAAPHTEFELFIKCMRGDRADNIPAAYPRISRKRLWQAFQHDAEMQRVMTTELTTEQPVATQYQLNRQLIDLSNVPDELLASAKVRLKALLG